MSAGDEFDNEDSAPLPPHERTWRHPAEVSNNLRTEHSLKAAPPPIGRRAAALVAFVSIVASATLMLVTVQKGVSEPIAEPVDVTSTSLPAKTGNTDNAVLVVHPYDDYYVAPSAEVTHNRLAATLHTGKTFDAELVTTFKEKGISVIRHRDATLRNLPYSTDATDVAELSSSFVAVDRSGRAFNTSRGITWRTSHGSDSIDPWFPLDVDGVIDSVALLYADDVLYGIAVRHHHEHYGILMADLVRLINDATVAQNG